MHYGLFSRIKRGSIMLWNVTSEKELPDRKTIKRLIGTDKFTFYKSHGHHREYIRLLGKLCLYRSSRAMDQHTGYWSQQELSHFLFTEDRLEANAFFLLRYAHSFFGTYYVDAADLKDLQVFLQVYEQARNIKHQVNRWSQTVQDHKNTLASENLKDSVIESFDIAKLDALLSGYGDEAIAYTKELLDQWHANHFWKPPK
jgi:hypothetical protein